MLSRANDVLVVEGLDPGAYELVSAQGGEQKSWPLQIRSGLQSFDVEEESLR